MYRFVRNPMYVAVLSIIFGQTLLFGSTTLLVYAIALWVAFQSFVMLYEEPTLRMQFGQSYDVYCANVSRWLPRLRPWSLDQRTIDPLMSSHVPQHQDSRELRASGDRNRNPRVGAAIRPQIERDE
jgi:hypothetical protein